jgi:hypothetical protein
MYEPGDDGRMGKSEKRWDKKMGQAIYYVAKFDELYSKRGRDVRTCD